MNKQQSRLTPPFLGIYGVGKAAVHPPALAILSHTPPGADPSENIAWVGKGIVYDTGGLSIKGKVILIIFFKLNQLGGICLASFLPLKNVQYCS